MFRRGVSGSTGSSRCISSYGGHELTADDIEAAKILLSLRSLIQSEPRKVFSVRWGSRKRRSAAYSEPSPPLLLPSPSPEILKLQAKPTSPVTTLAIWRSESDGKDKDSTERKSKRMRRDELRSRSDGLIKENQSLAEELKKKRTDYEQLQALNLGLRAKKIAFTFGVRLPELELLEESNSTSGNHHHQQQLESKIHLDQTKRGLESSTIEVFPNPISQVGPLLPSTVGSDDQNQNPLGIPDLNLFPEEVALDLVN